MKTVIQYSYFEDKDADGVAALMVKNNFWMGKYNRSLDRETFREYQNAKGFCFGVVGKIDDKYVTYVAAYKLGSQGAANSRQIVMSGLIIDESYRSSVFFLSDMFMLVLAKVREMGCTEMISEVGKNNKLSLFMMKKTGFVVLDDRPTIYGEVILRNYLPAILDCVWSDSMPDTNSLVNGMQSINKRNLLQPVEYLNSHVIITTWSVGKDRFEFLIDIISGEVVGIRCVGFFLFPAVRWEKICAGAGKIHEAQIPAGKYVCRGSAGKNSGTDRRVCKDPGRYYKAYHKDRCSALYLCPLPVCRVPGEKGTTEIRLQL